MSSCLLPDLCSNLLFHRRLREEMMRRTTEKTASTVCPLVVRILRELGLHGEPSHPRQCGRQPTATVNSIFKVTYVMIAHCLSYYIFCFGCRTLSHRCYRPSRPTPPARRLRRPSWTTAIVINGNGRSDPTREVQGKHSHRTTAITPRIFRKTMDFVNTLHPGGIREPMF